MECSFFSKNILAIVACGFLVSTSTTAVGYSKTAAARIAAAAVIVVGVALPIYSKSFRNVVKTTTNQGIALSLRLAKNLPLSEDNRNRIDSWITSCEENEAKRSPEDKSFKADEMADSTVKAIKLFGCLATLFSYLSNEKDVSVLPK